MSFNFLQAKRVSAVVEGERTVCSKIAQLANEMDQSLRHPLGARLFFINKTEYAMQLRLRARQLKHLADMLDPPPDEAKNWTQ